ncbi:hypothetical protein GmHk_04G010539 [Glycine max]|nr:hypothetical protein GmHk_04G010539 [Glycine max]
MNSITECLARIPRLLFKKSHSKSLGPMMQAPLELVGLGSSSSMDSFAPWKMNGSGMEKEEKEETPLQGEDESRRSSPP